MVHSNSDFNVNYHGNGWRIWVGLGNVKHKTIGKFKVSGLTDIIIGKLYGTLAQQQILHPSVELRVIKIFLIWKFTVDHYMTSVS